MEKMLWWNDKGVCSSRAKKTSTVSYMVFGYSILFVRRRLMRVSPRSESGKSPERLVLCRPVVLCSFSTMSCSVWTCG